MSFTRRTALLGLLAGCAGARPDPALPALDALYPRMPDAPAPGATPRMREICASFGRGINFGNMLDAPAEGEWGLRASDEFIGLVGEGGFTRSVRLPVRWSNHASRDASARIDPAFFARVDEVLDQLLARGCTVMLNMHHYHQLDGDPLDSELRVDDAVLRHRFLAMWGQIAERYAARDGNRLVFEVYNEAHGLQDGPPWNDLMSRAVRLIRRSNPTRGLVVGSSRWNSVDALTQLVLPPDPNLILTVHSYEPFEFTHQGATWVRPVKPTGVDCCGAPQLARMHAVLDKAVSEAARLGYPVFVGEFGAYEAAPMPARVRYARAMREAMEQRGLSWFWWELASGFGVYDPKAHAMRQPLFEALYR
ncbi:glycoside hydrolase family 5 protein [Pelomonas sp. KK5]|uniref:glycoside hydrolase family 5 protein n=1 Tax=Pelomonas sp. KK5 TaxID=1855730 RepID=UPI0009F92E0F|nr:glycoside hydrolase family 5 protein [Pelomonas sp. KK5]